MYESTILGDHGWFAWPLRQSFIRSYMHTGVAIYLLVSHLSVGDFSSVNTHNMHAWHVFGQKHKVTYICMLQ
jgi:hypothetical protein